MKDLDGGYGVRKDGKKWAVARAGRIIIRGLSRQEAYYRARNLNSKMVGKREVSRRMAATTLRCQPGDKE